MAQRDSIHTQLTADSFSTRDTLAVLSVALALDTHDWVRIASLLQGRALGSLQGARSYTKEDCQRIYQLAVDESRKSLNVVEAADSGTVLGNALGIAKRRRLCEIQERLRTIDSQIAAIDTSSLQRETENPLVSVDKEEQSEDQHLEEKPAPKHGVSFVSSDSENLAQSAEGKIYEDESTNTDIDQRSNQEQEQNTGSTPASPVLEDVDAHKEELYMTPEEQPKDVVQEHISSSANAVDSELKDIQANGFKEASLQQSVDDKISSKKAQSSSPQSKTETGDQDNAAMAEKAKEESENVDLQNLPKGEPQDAAAAQEAPLLWPKTDADAFETSGQPAVIASSEAASNLSPPVSASSNKSSALTADEQQLKNWKKNITTVWREISGHRYGGMFIGPIKSADAPNYYDVIWKPMDLKTIKNRIRDEEITTTVEFYRDIMQMLMNALMYNAEDTEIYQMTMEMIRDAQACIEQLLQTEATVNRPKGGSAVGEGTFGSSSISVARSADGTPVFGSGGFGHGLGLSLGIGIESGSDSTGFASPSTGGASLPSSAPLSASFARAEQDIRPQEQYHETEDSDSSLPAKRKRRMASERASKNLRA
ncbi:hypothetical protein LPJ64_001044 [Coemansia asiatica]|uniref:Bromo domain-containing protein n=1 Tax=Coemansia asiatica TaxID=1052880 RepID=A0A9W8CMA7_9FUNG|nr:hypothetical protein LPJ64_001044 [Coemansia asiatica]